MTMTKKDYVALSDALLGAVESNPNNRAAVVKVVNNLLPHLQLNVAFDTDRFIKACGLKVELHPSPSVALTVQDSRFALSA